MPAPGPFAVVLGTGAAGLTAALAAPGGGSLPGRHAASRAALAPGKWSQCKVSVAA